MQTLYDINLSTHIVAGGIGLVSMLVPLWVRKGGTLHRRAGWVFTVAMGLVSLTGLFIALCWLTVPLTVQPPSRPLEPAAQARYADMVRMSGLFFGSISVFVASALWQGIVAIRQRRGAIAWGNPIDRGFAWASLGMGVVLLVVGLVEISPLLLGFGVLGLFSGASELRFYRRGATERGAWVLRHLQAMLGGTTAAVTAFTVQAVGRVLTETGHGQWLLAAWGLPVVLGLGASHLWTRRMQRIMKT